MPRALGAVVTVCALLSGTGAVGLLDAGTAAAAPAAGRAGYCPDGDGVTVVIDFQQLGGGTVVRCAPGGHRTGLAALKAAGIDITGTNRWGESFICRIQGKPGPQSEPCVDTPPADAYWSYWHAPNGGRWTYSQRGVTYRTPPKGSFEGWSFSLDRSANDAPAPRLAPRRPASGSSGGNGGGSGGGGAQRPGQDNGVTSGGGGASGNAPGSATGGAAPERGDAAGGSRGDGAGGGKKPGEDKRNEDGKKKAEKGKDKDGKRTKAAKDSPGPVATPTEAEDWNGGEGQQEEASGSSGVPVGTVVGGAAAAGLVATGGIVAWRRRRSQDQNASTS